MVEHKKSIINGIKAALDHIDDGQFQSFCLDFLPMHNNTYQQLKRHGGTSTGKTRKGTPDLIKTLATGEQIAVQCSVEENYWRKPKKEEKYNSWKPISDINDCISKVENLKEIVLCSNKETPTNLPNIKSEIIQKYKNNTKITILDRVDIEKTLLENTETPSFEIIAKTYFPEIYSLIRILREARENQLAIELREEKAAPFKDILRIARKAVEKIVDLDGQKQYALEEIKRLHSSFQIIPLPSAGTIEREIPTNSSLINPCGIIQVLAGVPKVGKTFLGSQLASMWRKIELEVRWFECPPETQQEIFIQDISRNLWELFLPPEQAYELSIGVIQPHSIEVDKLNYRNDRNLVYIIDNAEQLAEKYLKKLCGLLVLLKKHAQFKNIGLLFLTNKGLKHLCHAIDKQLTAPGWYNKELIQFLSEKLPNNSHFKSPKYMKLLETMSSGHPLVALALAKKYPSAPQLILNSLSGPSLGDEDLATEIKQLLFNELIQDSDLRSFVTRLSQLTTKARNKTLFALIKIQPAISTPIKLIIDKLLGTVIEGTEVEGYSVPFVYKEVAKKQLTEEQQKEIYNAVSLVLLTPEGKIINAEDTIDGIYYSIFAGELTRAFFWAIMLFQNLNNKKLTNIQINAILNRLTILKYLKIPEQEDLLLYYYCMLITMALVHIRIKNKSDALNILERIQLPGVIHDGKIKQIANTLINLASLFRFTLSVIDNPSESAKIFISLDFSCLKQSGYGQFINEITKQLIHSLSIKDLSRPLLEKIFETYKLNSADYNENLIDLATSLGLKGSKEKIPPQDLIKLLPKVEISEILHNVIACQYYLETGASDYLSYAENAIRLFEKQNLQDKNSKNRILILLGDAHYKIGNSSQAKIAYQQARVCLTNKKFDCAWINWRLGLLSEIPEEAERYFRCSTYTFLKTGAKNLATKSFGEISITLVQQKKYTEYADSIFSILKRYYIRGDKFFAPTAMVAMAQTTRLIWEIGGKPIENSTESVFPAFERRTFDKVLDIAKPKAGGNVAFYSLGKLYGILDTKEKKIKCLLIALNFHPTNEIEEKSNLVIINDLLEEFISQKDYEKMALLMLKGINLQRFNSLSLPYLSYCIFSNLDKLINSLPPTEHFSILKLLDKIKTEIIKDASIQNREWWLAEIYSRILKVNKLNNAPGRILYELAGNEYKYGLKSNNASAIIESGNFYGYPSEIWNMKAVVDIHLEILKSIEAQDSDSKRLRIHGLNLFAYWSKIDYKHLSEHELRINKTMRESSRILLKTHMNPDSACPIILLLLASLYNYRGKATEWAVNQIIEKNINIPAEVLNCIKNYLLS
jgi:hypothetical protein